MSLPGSFPNMTSEAVSHYRSCTPILKRLIAAKYGDTLSLLYRAQEGKRLSKVQRAEVCSLCALLAEVCAVVSRHACRHMQPLPAKIVLTMAEK